MRRKFTLALSTLALVALTGAGVAQTALPSGPPGRLRVWVGRWPFSGQIYQTKYSQAQIDTGIADCSWTANKGYIICDYFSNHPPHNDLALISYDPSGRSYTIVNVHKDRAPAFGNLTLNGNTWTTSSEFSDKGKTLVRRTTFVFPTPDRQTTTVQISSDKGKTWITILRVTAVKTGS